MLMKLCVFCANTACAIYNALLCRPGACQALITLILKIEACLKGLCIYSIVMEIVPFLNLISKFSNLL